MSRIVVGITTGTQPEPALDFAVGEALRRHADLKVVHAYETQVYVEAGSGEWGGGVQQQRADAHRRASLTVGAATHRLARGRSLKVTLEVVQSDVVGALVLAADGALLLVVGRRPGGSFTRAVHGSVSAGCLHHASVPVAVVPHGATEEPDRWLRSRVLVGLDGSAPSVAALGWGARAARAWQCALLPVIVCPSYGQVPPPMRSAISRSGLSLRGLVGSQLAAAGAGDLPVEPRYVVGGAVRELARILQPHDLLVVGSRGHGALAGLLLGSTSFPLAERSACPVVVVRATVGDDAADALRAEPSLIG